MKHNIYDTYELQQDRVSNIASIIATYKQVRNLLIQKQRQFIKNQKGVIVEGRDVGSYLFPEADYKFYLNADINTRSQRRFNQLQNTKKNTIYSNVYNCLQKRDLRDTNREYHPLIKAPSAFLIDSSKITVKKVFNIILTNINQNLIS